MWHTLSEAAGGLESERPKAEGVVQDLGTDRVAHARVVSAEQRGWQQVQLHPPLRGRPGPDLPQTSRLHPSRTGMASPGVLTPEKAEQVSRKDLDFLRLAVEMAPLACHQILAAPAREMSGSASVRRSERRSGSLNPSRAQERISAKLNRNLNIRQHRVNQVLVCRLFCEEASAIRIQRNTHFP